MSSWRHTCSIITTVNCIVTIPYKWSFFIAPIYSCLSITIFKFFLYYIACFILFTFAFLFIMVWNFFKHIGVVTMLCVEVFTMIFFFAIRITTHCINKFFRSIYILVFFTFYDKIVKFILNWIITTTSTTITVIL